MNRLRATTATIPGIRTILMPVQNLDFTGGRIARAKYQYTLQSGDIDALYSKAPEMERAMAQLPGLRDVNSDLQISNPQWRVDIDREKAAAFGITADAVRTALYDAFGTRQISTIFTEADDYQVILEASDKFQNDPTRSVASASRRRPASSCRSTKWRRCGAPSGRCRSTASRSSRR
jgi:HAE1 family hydrophobic/amphiphilic exporter-1